MIGNNVYGGGGGKQQGIYPIGADGLPTGDVIVPEGVTNLDSNVLSGNQTITSVKLPASCTSLNNGCFRNCTKLKRINIPDGVKTIPDNCFYNTEALTSISISKSVTTIGDTAFNYSGVSNIQIEDGAKFSLGSSCFSRTNVTNEDVKNILEHNASCYGNVFDYTTTITDIDIPFSWNGMFGHCSNLRKVTIRGGAKSSSETLYHFGQSAFSNCSALEEFIIDIAEGKQPIQKISYYAFCYCTKLASFTIPDTVQEIGDSAFNSCLSLTTINIPASVTKIGDSAFNDVGSLESLSIDNDASYELGRYCFMNNPRITSAEIVKEVLSHANKLGDQVFANCKGLPAELEIPKTGAAYMFKDCTTLVKVTVTGYLDTLATGSYIFQNCTALEEAILSEGAVTIDGGIFNGCRKLKKVYLPSSITSAPTDSLSTTSSSYYIFQGCTSLEDVQVGENWNMSLRLNVSSKLTADSMIAMFNNLKDLTGEAAKTLTLGATNLAKLTDEQKAIATNKNWTLA